MRNRDLCSLKSCSIAIPRDAETCKAQPKQSKRAGFGDRRELGDLKARITRSENAKRTQANRTKVHVRLLYISEFRLCTTLKNIKVIQGPGSTGTNVASCAANAMLANKQARRS